MSADWKADKQWSDKFLHEIKGIVGQTLIGEVEEEDQQRNTDLIVLKLEAVRIACRIRRNSYFQNNEYKQQFTIRTKRHSGAETELSKVLSGWGDYIFYGFSDESEESIVAWIIGDLAQFRIWFVRYITTHQGKYPGLVKTNGDGSSDFIAFNLSELPERFIVNRNTVLQP